MIASDVITQSLIEFSSILQIPHPYLPSSSHLSHPYPPLSLYPITAKSPPPPLSPQLIYRLPHTSFLSVIQCREYLCHSLIPFGAFEFPWLDPSKYTGVIWCMQALISNALVIRSSVVCKDCLTCWAKCWGNAIIQPSEAQYGKYVHRFYRVYATRRVISPISPCYLVRPGG